QRAQFGHAVRAVALRCEVGAVAVDRERTVADAQRQAAVGAGVVPDVLDPELERTDLAPTASLVLVRFGGGAPPGGPGGRDLQAVEIQADLHGVGIAVHGHPTGDAVPGELLDHADRRAYLRLGRRLRRGGWRRGGHGHTRGDQTPIARTHGTSDAARK